MSGPDGLPAYWMAETVRLREAHWGPLEDASESRQARAQGRELPDKILLRARYLGRREKLDELLAHWTRGARLTLLALAIAGLFAGAGAALGALGDGSRPVNLLLALFAMLGLHTLTFLAWLLSFGVHARVAGLGRLWLWLTRKLARSPDAALAPRAPGGDAHQQVEHAPHGREHAVWRIERRLGQPRVPVAGQEPAAHEAGDERQQHESHE